MISLVAVDDLLLERTLRVIDEGRRTATYKLALLAAIIDAAAISPGEAELPTRLLADRVLAIYYPQTRQYVDSSGTTHRPRQISNKSSAVVRAVEELRVVAESRRLRGVDALRAHASSEFDRALDAVEDTFVRYPIPLMQVIGNRAVPFLYEIDWPEGTSARALRRRRQDRIRLFDGVNDRLVVLGPLLRPLIELHWTRDVARWTGVNLEDEALRTHLFGAERVAFPHLLVAGLEALQDGRCFYCDDRISGRGHVDHFVPWSRWKNDAIENLVLADRCNGHKSDHLAAVTHLTRWRLRNTAQREELADIAANARWLSAADRTWALARSTYAHLPNGTPLWVEGRTFQLLEASLTDLVAH